MVIIIERPVGAYGNISETSQLIIYKIPNRWFPKWGIAEKKHQLNVEIGVSLKVLSNSWRTLEIALTNCKFNQILTGSPTCVLRNSTGKEKFAITDIKL